MLAPPPVPSVERCSRLLPSRKRTRNDAPSSRAVPRLPIISMLSGRPGMLAVVAISVAGAPLAVVGIAIALLVLLPVFLLGCLADQLVQWLFGVCTGLWC